MDDTTLQDLENELKALRPRRPSVLLRARVEHDLSQPTSPAQEAEARSVPQTPSPRPAAVTPLRWFSWQLAAAATVALAVSLGVWRWQAAGSTPGDAMPVVQPAIPDAGGRPQASEPDVAAPRTLAARDTYRPVKAANVLYDLQDEGPVLLEDNTPARRVRARYVDTYTWKNPATNASIKWSVPRDEVRVMPASFH